MNQSAGEPLWFLVQINAKVISVCTNCLFSLELGFAAKPFFKDNDYLTKLFFSRFNIYILFKEWCFAAKQCQLLFSYFLFISVIHAAVCGGCC